MSDSVRHHRRQPTRLPRPWDSPGKNTGVGCHFLLQCMKVKSQSEVAQSCLTLCDPMDCSPPGSSIHGIFQAREYWSGVPLLLLSTLRQVQTLMHSTKSLSWSNPNLLFIFISCLSFLCVQFSDHITLYFSISGSENLDTLPTSII